MPVLTTRLMSRCSSTRRRFVIKPFQAFSESCMEHMESVAIQPTHEGGILRIVVHIRTGDVSLGTHNAHRRYLPNSNYIRLIDEVLESIDQDHLFVKGNQGA